MFIEKSYWIFFMSLGKKEYEARPGLEPWTSHLHVKGECCPDLAIRTGYIVSNYINCDL